MVHNFETWRKATESRYQDGAVRHFHKVQDTVFLDLRGFLCQLVVRRIDTGRAQQSVNITDELCNNILVFLDEMDNAYIHPRSTSARMRFSREKIPANPLT